MDSSLGPQALDTTRVYEIELGTADGSSLAGHFTGSETLTARLWPGGQYPTLAALSAAWDPAISGNPASLAHPILLLTVAKAAIAGLAPGSYQVEILADPDEALYRGPIRFEPAPGSAALPRTYCDLADLQAECSWIDAVQALAGARAGSFLDERAEASRWVEAQALARWRRDGEDQLRRHGPISATTPITITGGVDGGPWWGPSTLPDADLRAAESAFGGLLDSPGLCVDHPADRGTLRQLTALYALYLVLDDQLGKAPDGETPLQKLAVKYRSRAVRRLKACTLRVDSDLDGVADFELRP